MNEWRTEGETRENKAQKILELFRLFAKRRLIVGDVTKKKCSFIEFQSSSLILFPFRSFIILSKQFPLWMSSCTKLNTQNHVMKWNWRKRQKIASVFNLEKLKNRCVFYSIDWRKKKCVLRQPKKSANCSHFKAFLKFSSSMT